MRRLVLLLLAAGSTAHLSQAALTARRPARLIAAAPPASPAALRLMALGYRQLAADLFWLRAISHFGDRQAHAQNYPQLGPLLTAVVGLDPDFLAAYIFAGSSLTLAHMDHALAMRLLAQGVAQRPEIWRLPFLLGFNAYYLVGDDGLAAQALSQAARLPEAPEYVGALATRLAAHAGTPEVGLDLVAYMLATTQDPQLQAMYLERQQLLRLEVDLRALQGATAAFQRTHGRPPTHLDQLVEVGLLAAIPEDPLGGAFGLTHDGIVTTRHEQARLRLNADARLPGLNNTTAQEGLQHADDDARP